MAISIRKPGEVLTQKKPTGRSVVLYGPPLVGKTTTLGNDPNFRVCVIDLDKNTTTIEESDNVTIIGCDSVNDYLAVKEGVDTGFLTLGKEKLKMDFDGYAIDSFTTLEEKYKTWVATELVPNRQRELKGRFGAQSDWEDLQRNEVGEVRDWQRMTKREKNPINVIWIGHDMTLTNEMGQAYATQLMLQGKYAAPRIVSAVDAVFYMFKTEKDGKVHRGIFTQDRGIFKADARMPIDRRDDLKAVIYNPKWGEIFEAMGAEKQVTEEK